MGEFDLRWREDFASATIQSDGAFFGTLTVEQWWTEARGEPQVAWVAGYLDPETESWIKVCAEVPAQAVTKERTGEVLAKVERAIAEGPREVAGPDLRSAPEKPTVSEVDRQLDLVIHGWVRALDELFRVCARRDPDNADGLYVPLAQALNWLYTVDLSLQAAWNRLPVARQVWASEDTDKKASAAIANLTQHQLPGWDASADPVFRAYHERQARGGRPYQDWASVMLAGAFHDEFFAAAQWISGKLRHSATRLTIELLQMTPGGEPRWKWKRAATIPRDEREDDARAAFERHLEGKDVTGLFSWLVDVFADAQRLVVHLLTEAEAAGEY